MKIKSGVNPFGVRNEITIALLVADGVWRDNGQELVVTSLNDSKHSRESLHYAGAAADLRTRYFSNPESVAQQLREALGNNPDYDVVVEKDHIHLEHQPKYRSLPKET